jgi:hypothetical protein
MNKKIWIKGIEEMCVNCEYQIDDLEDNTIIATLCYANYSDNPTNVFYMMFRSNLGTTYKFYEKDIINFEDGILNVVSL